MKITVFYDGKCGLCTREINHYRKIAPKSVFDWQDITQTKVKLEQAGIHYIEALKYLHVLDEIGHIHRGVDSFIVIWKQIPRWRLLGCIVSFPIIRQMATLIYKYFADWRFKRLAHCQLADK